MRVLVLTLSFGSGHVRAAEVIADEVSRQAAGADVRMVDALADCRAVFRAGYVWPYWAMLRHAPDLWSRMFSARVNRKHRHTAPDWVFKFGCSTVFKTIAQFRPDVIVATEVGAAEIGAIAKRSGLSDVRVVAVITDYQAEPAWVKPEVAVYAVAIPEVGEQLQFWGASPEEIVVTGIPTDRKFSKRHDKKSVRMRYGLSDDSPIVLLMGGGMGPTHMDEIAAGLIVSGAPMQIVAIAGHDVRTSRKLARLRSAAPVSLRVLDWVDDVAPLMQTAAVLVTKPGGLTIAEAAMCSLPVVMFDAIPGPEQSNVARLTGAGAGLMTNKAPETTAAVLSLLRDEHLRRRMSTCATRLACPEATATIARLALVDIASAENVARRTRA